MKRYKIFEATNGHISESDDYAIELNGKGDMSIDTSKNIFITETGKIQSVSLVRREEINNVSGFFENGNDVFLVQNGDLYKYPLDLSVGQLLATGLSTVNRTNFVFVAGKIYYSDGLVTGCYSEGSCGPWGESDSEINSKTKRVMDKPYPSIALAFFAGRIFHATEDCLWFSEPGNYSQVDRARDFIPFDSKIVSLISLESALYVGTENGLYLIQVFGDTEFSSTKVLDEKVISLSSPVIKTSRFFSEQGLSGKSVFIVTVNGIYACDGAGRTFNFSRYWFRDFEPSGVYDIYNIGHLFIVASENNAWAISVTSKCITFVPTFSGSFGVIRGSSEKRFVDSGGTKIETEEDPDNDFSFSFIPFTAQSPYRLSPRFMIIQCAGDSNVSILLSSDIGIEKEFCLEVSDHTVKKFPIPRTLKGDYFNISIAGKGGFYLKSIEMYAGQEGQRR
jgi:hypothetical protein